MHLELIDYDSVWADLVENRVQVICCQDFYDGKLDEVIASWIDGKDDDVSVSIKFTLSAILDGTIEGHELWAYDKATHAKAKPLFDAMRTELTEMIDRIDALKFLDPDND